MKRLLVLLAIVLPLGFQAQEADVIDYSQALKIATDFFNSNPLATKSISSDNLTLVSDAPFVFNQASGKGFVIVSPYTSEQPILAYSFEHPFNPNTPGVEDWLNFYRTARPTLPSSGETKDGGVEPLLQTFWAQTPYYNTQCPFDNTEGVQTTAGSVVTAMAQVMRFWQHPNVGLGNHSYSDPNYGVQEADFGHSIYRWSQMPLLLDDSSSSAAIEAVSKLIYHCGVASETYFGTPSNRGGSTYVISYGIAGFVCAESALRDHFKYRSSIQGIMRNNYGDNQWASLLKDELDAGRPVIYSAYHEYTSISHAFVCDGYDNNGLFHFNWGWNGDCDGYYDICNLSPVHDSMAYHFLTSQNAIIGIEPDHTLPDDTTIVAIDVATNDTPLLTLFPNPTTERVSISTSAPIETIELCDIQGRVLNKWKVDCSQKVIDLTPFAAGIYVIRVVCDGKTSQQRLVIIR